MSEKRVYFLKPIGMAGPIKIGCSILPETRLRAFDIWSPFPLEIVASAPGGHQDESNLHWRFRSGRSHGEWFLVSVELLNLIDQVRLTGVLPPLEVVPPRARKETGRKLRNLAWRRAKTALGKRFHAAETHAYGFLTARWGNATPARIKALREKCLGAHQPPLQGHDLAEMEAYIADLLARPDGRNSDRELAARAALDAKWDAGRKAREAAA